MSKNRVSKYNFSFACDLCGKLFPHSVKHLLSLQQSFSKVGSVCETRCILAAHISFG